MPTDAPLLFNIQKYSLFDGPGIRTVFFFKGCPLSCRWCSNPESQSPAAEIAFEERVCMGCGRCVATCPNEALSADTRGISVDRRKCTVCLACVEGCPTGAMLQYGRRYEIDELVAIAAKDSAFYRRSGGGVTLSGGEPLLYPAFAKELLAACRDEALDTAIETCGAVEWNAIAEVAPLIDTFYFDLKHVDDAKHREGTRHGVEPTLSNLRRLATGDANLVVRYPFIPNFNTAPEDVEAIAEWVAENAPGRRVELMPYHRYGEKKYATLDRLYTMEGTTVPSDEEIASAVEVFTHRGIECVRMH
ncbi:glycyl-radical enzyme activating protein [Synergistaceae bacterium OttesenSCG-928-I11]|nr:glycyl-radical enzyme activating protein [Synergistaceae bacterium OttesenSCG-928-I11]